MSVLPGQSLGPEGFQLSISLSKVHLPRMWVEKHPDKDSQVCVRTFFFHSGSLFAKAPPPSLSLSLSPSPQACMLVFYPDFDIDSRSPSSNEVVLLLDTSESMGDVLHTVQEIALRVLKALDPDVKVNVILFGTGQFDEVLKTAGGGFFFSYHVCVCQTTLKRS